MTSETGNEGGGAKWRRPAAAAAVVAAALALFANGRSATDLPGQDAPAAIVIAPQGEPGERLVVRGRVFAPDGETPVARVVLYAYQTGLDGRYAPFGQRVPRLRGWVRTDAEGRYEIRTIRPGAYPGRSTPAHVHVQLWGAGYEPQWSSDLLFADDPSLPAGERERSRNAGRFAHVCTPQRLASGDLACEHNHRLKTAGDDFGFTVRHGFQAAGENR